MLLVINTLVIMLKTIIFRLFSVLSCLLISGCHYGMASDYFDRDMTQLLNTIVKQDRVRARELLNQGLDLNIHGQEGITPLIWLVMKKDKSAIRLALELGADPNFSAGDGDSLLAMVAGGNDDELLVLLLDNGADPNSVNRHGAPAVFGAIAYHKFEQIRILMRYGVDIDKTDKSSLTPASYATTFNFYDIVHFFLEQGADHTIRDSSRGDLAWSLHDALKDNLIRPDSEQMNWALKVKEWLISKGVSFPPPSPREIRIKEGRPNMWDLEAMEKEKKKQ